MLEKILPELEEEMKFLADLFESDRDVRQYFISPQFSKDSKRSVIIRIYQCARAPGPGLRF